MAFYKLKTENKFGVSVRRNERGEPCIFRKDKVFLPVKLTNIQKKELSKKGSIILRVGAVHKGVLYSVPTEREAETLFKKISDILIIGDTNECISV